MGMLGMMIKESPDLYILSTLTKDGPTLRMTLTALSRQSFSQAISNPASTLLVPQVTSLDGVESTTKGFPKIGQCGLMRHSDLTWHQEHCRNLECSFLT